MQLSPLRAPPRSWAQNVSGATVQNVGGITVTGTGTIIDSGAAGHLLSTNGTTRPSAVAGQALGTGGTASVGFDPRSTDVCQIFAAVGGSAPGTAGTLATVTFGATYPPSSIVMPQINAASSSYWNLGFSITNVTTSGYTIAVTTPAAASVTYGFSVSVVALAPPVIPVTQSAGRPTATSAATIGTTTDSVPPGIYTKSIVLATP